MTRPRATLGRLVLAAGILSLGGCANTFDRLAAVGGVARLVENWRTGVNC